MNSRILKKAEELQKIVEEETGQKPDIGINFHNAGNFSDVVKKSNIIAREINARNKRYWANGGCGGMELKHNDTEFSFYFDQPFN